MYNKTKIIGLIIITISLSACSNKQSAIEPSMYNETSLELNAGKKWEISQEMMPHLQHSFALIDKFKVNKKTNYQDLATKLDQEKDKFVSSCNMSGKGHDILHAWLMPYLEILDQLSNTSDQIEGERLLNELLHAKKIFLEHFK